MRMVDRRGGDYFVVFMTSKTFIDDDVLMEPVVDEEGWDGHDH